MTKDLVEYIIKSLVDHPESVEVSEFANRHQINIDVQVASPDVGRVIGRNGRVINAIRNVLEAVVDDDRRISIEVN